MEKRHTDRAFDQDLNQLSGILMRMGEICQEMVGRAGTALLEGQGDELALAVTQERLLDSLADEADQNAMHLVAKRQPMASDLREVLASIRIASEFRRIGVMSRNIVERSLQMQRSETLNILRDDLSALIGMVADFVSRVHAARTSARAGELEELCSTDDDIDRAFENLTGRIVELLAQHSDQTLNLTHALFCAKNLERIGDHASHIAQAAHLALTGQLPRQSVVSA